MALLRAGKVRFELTPEGEVDQVEPVEERKSLSKAASILSTSQIGI